MSNTNIFIPFEDYKSIGGPATFMSNLKRFLDYKGFSYTQNIENANAIFFPISYDIKVLKKLKKKGAKIIQRLDGIYYPEKHGKKYSKKNKIIKDIYLNYADFVVFQSEYSKKQCFEMFGAKKENEYAIILNGVDKSIFYPTNDIDTAKPEKVKFIATGDFRKLDMIEPIVKALDLIKNSFPFEFNIVGPAKNKEVLEYLNRDYINYLGPRNIYEIADLLKNSDIFLFSSLNPPCPNSVLEAISSGLPVIGFDDGAMPELVNFSQDLLAPASGSIFKKQKDLDHEKFAEKILLILDNYKHYKEKAIENSGLYSFEDCGEKYMAVFKEQIKSSCINKKFNKRVNILSWFVKRIAKTMNPEGSLVFLLKLQSKLYDMLGSQSIRYGKGIHTKHKHIQYHNFFIENISSNKCILDVGCGYGALAFSIANEVNNLNIYAIDIVEKNIVKAKEKFAHPNIKYIHGDALKDLPEENIDIVILSNVLEHIENRVDFLKQLKNKYNPEKFLIRVPVFERDWLVPLKQELGIDYRLDSTHFIEYLTDEFLEEIKKAELCIESYKINWGEIWALVKP